MAGAKVCKNVNWTIPGLPKDGDFKKHKRDHIKSGKAAVGNIGVADTLPKIVMSALPEA